MPDSQPSRMLAVLLGASEFPKSPQLLESRSFYNSAYDVKEYLCGANGMALPRGNVLSLFNDTQSSSDQLEHIAEFLGERDAYLKSLGSSPEQLLIYYVGHGLFTRGADQAYCLAVRNTNQYNEGPTSLRAADLATVVKETARHLKRYLVLDCCFAASMQKEFQSSALSVVRAQINREFPERGTALMCSSNAYEPSRAPQGLEHTMFSSALLRSLRTGDKQSGPRLTFSELGELVRDYIRETFPENGVRPEVHSPDQREGDVANDPLFPNPAYVERQRAKSGGRTGNANPAPVARAAIIAAPVRQARRAKQEIATQEPVRERQAAPARTVSRGKTSTAKPAKLVTASALSRQKAAEARERKLAKLENDKKVQLAAKKAAQQLLLEWQKRERAKKLEQKRVAKQKAEEREARIAAQEERLRKEKRAAQEAAAERELIRLRSQRAVAAGRKGQGGSAGTKEKEPAARVRAANTARISVKSEETRVRERARAAAQSAAADRELARLRRERAMAAGRKGTSARADERKGGAAANVAKVSAARRPAKSQETRAQERARRASQNAAAERELRRIRSERDRAAEQKCLAKQKNAVLYEEPVEEEVDQDLTGYEPFEASDSWGEQMPAEAEALKRPRFQDWLNKFLGTPQ